MFSIQNRQKRTFIIPALFKPDGSAAHENVNIAPGSSALIQDDHWEGVAKGNAVIEALLTQRHLVVTKGTNTKPDLDPEELKNPRPAEAPAELTEKDERVKIESKVELKDIQLKDDGPTEGKSKAK